MSNKTIFLKPDQEYMTLQALLQVSDVISTGGMAKVYLMENVVKVNGEEENRRGRKLYPGDVISLANATFVIKKP